MRGWVDRAMREFPHAHIHTVPYGMDNKGQMASPFPIFFAR